MKLPDGVVQYGTSKEEDLEWAAIFHPFIASAGIGVPLGKPTGISTVVNRYGDIIQASATAIMIYRKDGNVITAVFSNGTVVSDGHLVLRSIYR